VISVNSGYKTGGLVFIGGVFGQNLGEDDLFIVHPPQLKGDLKGKNYYSPN
jgi:hypothetical protein